MKQDLQELKTGLAMLTKENPDFAEGLNTNWNRITDKYTLLVNLYNKLTRRYLHLGTAYIENIGALYRNRIYLVRLIEHITEIIKREKEEEDDWNFVGDKDYKTLQSGEGRHIHDYMQPTEYKTNRKKLFGHRKKTRTRSKKKKTKSKFSSRKLKSKRSKSRKFGYQAKQEFQVARDLYDLAATVNRGCSS